MQSSDTNYTNYSYYCLPGIEIYVVSFTVWLSFQEPRDTENSRNNNNLHCRENLMQADIRFGFLHMLRYEISPLGARKVKVGIKTVRT